MSVITWLHISDLHFRASDKFDSAVVTQALLKDISQRENIAPALKKIDLIFITGDIAFSGKPDEYEVAQEFLNQLLKVTGTRKSRVFIVPGNHDVDRTKILDDSREILNKLDNRQAVNGLLNDPNARAMFMRRFTHYGEFFNRYFKNHLYFDSENYFYVAHRKIQKTRIAIIGLNSAWASSSDQDRLNLFLGERQVRNALPESLKKSSDFRIVLVHHPFDWLRDFDSADCEPIILRNSNAVLFGHLHKTNFFQKQIPGAGPLLIGAGAGYESREHPNGYSFAHISLDSGSSTLYLRTYSDREGGFWAPDTISYPDVQGIYSFQLSRYENNQEKKLLDKDVITTEVLPDETVNQETLTKTTSLREKVGHIPPDTMKKWWEGRGYNSNPFLYDNAKDVPKNSSFSDIFQWWYVDPNLPASTNGLGVTPTIDDVLSVERIDPVLIYAPSGGGKTFCRLWGVEQAEAIEKGGTIEITDLVGRLSNLNQITALDLLLCIQQAIFEKYGIAHPITYSDNLHHVLHECNNQLKKVITSNSGPKRIIIFVDDIDKLFDESNIERNLKALRAISELCEAFANQSGTLLAIRLFFPLELKEPLQSRLSNRNKLSIRGVTLLWDADHCESVIEARLGSCWKSGPNNYMGRHLERLFQQDALTELRRQLHNQYPTPRCSIRFLQEICEYAYQNHVTSDDAISVELLIKFLNDKTSLLCPQIQYPLTDKSTSKHLQNSFFSRFHNIAIGDKLILARTKISQTVDKISKISDWVSAFWLLCLFVATVIFLVWLMIQELWFGRHIDVPTFVRQIWEFVVQKLQ